MISTWLIHTMIESSHEHLMPTKFHFYSMNFWKVTVCFILQHCPWNQYSISLRALELHRLSWLRFRKDILLSKMSVSHHWSFSSVELFNFQLLLKNCHYNMFWTTNPMECVRPIFKILLENTTIITSFLKNHICDISCIEINILFVIFNNKELKNFKVTQPAFTCSMLTIETVEQGVKYVQS